MEEDKIFKLRVLELYSGIGGMHWALKESGIPYEVVMAVDINTTANHIYRHNFPRVNLNCFGIEKLSLKKLHSLKPNAILMSPPCQPFSRVGKKGDCDDVRTKSFLHVMHLMRQADVKPSYILVENVKGFDCSKTRQILVDTLNECNYRFQEYLLTPLQFGIPNSRLRYYMIATLKGTQPGLIQSSQLLYNLPCQHTTQNSNNSLHEDNQSPATTTTTTTPKPPSSSPDADNKERLSTPADSVPPPPSSQTPPLLPLNSHHNTASSFSNSSNSFNINSSHSQSKEDTTSSTNCSICSTTSTTIKNEKIKNTSTPSQHTTDTDITDKDVVKTKTDNLSFLNSTVADANDTLFNKSESIESQRNSTSSSTPALGSSSNKDDRGVGGLPLTLLEAGKNMRFCEESDELITPNSRCLSEFMEQGGGDGDDVNENDDGTTKKFGDLLVSDKDLRQFVVMDILLPQLRKSSCFTKRYGHYIEGAGSLIQMSTSAKDTQEASSFKSQAVELKNKHEWGEEELSIVRRLKLRYFSPREVANLLCFPPDFGFPDDVSNIQKYRCLGNSLNVYVVSRLIRLMTLGI